MEEERIIHINIIIADRPYPLKIKQSEEETIRQVTTEINQKVKEFQKSYVNKDKQDFLAMTALLFAVESLTQKKANNSLDESIHHEVTKFEDFIKKF